MQSYLIPAEQVTVSQEIKKSRFITYLAPTEGMAAAKEYVQQIRQQHAEAHHHCWACIAGAPDDSQRLGFSDDGEPAGTAGKPMLAQLMGSQLGEVTTVVVRYYGGVKLGTGGLVKAYGSGVRQALEQVVTKLKIAKMEYQLHCDYSQLKLIENLLKQSNGEMIDIDYGMGITLRIAIPVTEEDAFAIKLNNMSRGVLVLQPLTR